MLGQFRLSEGMFLKQHYAITQLIIYGVLHKMFIKEKGHVVEAVVETQA
jgi:hypothetical protein